MIFDFSLSVSIGPVGPIFEQCGGLDKPGACTLLFSGSYFNSKKWSYKKRYRITPFLELKVTPLVVLKCNTTFGAILTPFSGVKI